MKEFDFLQQAEWNSAIVGISSQIATSILKSTCTVNVPSNFYIFINLSERLNANNKLKIDSN